MTTYKCGNCNGAVVFGKPCPVCGYGGFTIIEEVDAWAEPDPATAYYSELRIGRSDVLLASGFTAGIVIILIILASTSSSWAMERCLERATFDTCAYTLKAG